MIAELKQVEAGASFFDGIHIFTPHSGVKDDSAMRLVVLPPECWYTREETRLAVEAPLDWMKNNGNQPRHRRNRLLFLAADHGTLFRLNDAARVALAWGSIVGDVKEGRLNIDRLQESRLKRSFKLLGKSSRGRLANATYGCCARLRSHRPTRSRRLNRSRSTPLGVLLGVRSNGCA
jgi:predicted AAA+ superfamily ATPase